jgi:2-dehydropantoate 2-reductase
MKIAIFGAGLIGCYVGGSLISGGADVTLIGRPRMAQRIARHGLTLSDLDGGQVALSPDQVNFQTDPSALAGCDLILVTVKSGDSVAAAQAILQHAPATALVLSCQNGVGNVELLRSHLPSLQVLAAMVPFNVAETADGTLHRGTEGQLMAEAALALNVWQPDFERARLPLQLRSDMQAVQWGKLLLNLNNSVNALADQPLRQQLSQRDYRRCLALLIEEALQVLQHANIRPARLAKVSPAWLPTVLRLPDFLFTRLAQAMLRIDPQARSSMWEDLQAGRRTEIDFLNGAVVRLAASHGVSARHNSQMVQLVKAAQEAEQGDRERWSGTELLEQLNRKVGFSGLAG